MDHVRENLGCLLETQLTDLLIEFLLLKDLLGTLADSISEG